MLHIFISHTKQNMPSTQILPGSARPDLMLSKGLYLQKYLRYKTEI